MKRTILFGLFALGAVPTSASAQFFSVVFDPSVYGQVIQQVIAVNEQLSLWRDIARGAQNIQAYRLSPLDVPLLSVRQLGSPVLYGEGVPDGFLEDTDTRLTAAISNASRLAAFSQAIAGRISTLQQDVTAPGRSMTSILDTQAAAQLIAVQQAEARQRVLEAQYDLELQRAIQERNDRATQAQQRVNLRDKPRVDLGVQSLTTTTWGLP